MKEIDPMKTNRALSWKLYINAPMPMVTIFKTIDISNLIKLKKKGYKLNMLMCYCIGLAANDIDEFKLLPVAKKMIQYNNIGINVIVLNQYGSLSTCDIPFKDDLNEFNDLYLKLVDQVYQTGDSYEITDHMIIGTSSLIKYDFDGLINMYSGIYNNPMLFWGKYFQENETMKLKISFQFHHVQMDGIEACEFLEKLQNYINNLTVD